MTVATDEFAELRALVDALCEESITAAQVRRLEVLVLGCPRAEAFYVRSMALHAALGRRFSGRHPSAGQNQFPL
jgi:hypothetical protein